ncbi:hypothetical protein GCM10027580_15420 [Corynebacterium faecale]|uniref:hypothetical protein n=1 Tax=Corynebacterium faecale TaxID=1758466 RepID=UPI0025B4081E|nr:hypothetical protein [Corynebacterium faecale]
MSFQDMEAVKLDVLRAEDEAEVDRKQKRRARNRATVLWVGTGVLAVILITLLMVYFWSRAQGVAVDTRLP